MLDADDESNAVAGEVEGPKVNVKTEKLQKATDSQKQLRLAKLLIARIGKDNILYYEPIKMKDAGGKSSGSFWGWCGKVWNPYLDRFLKQHIHEIAQGERLSKTFVDSVLDLAKTEAFRNGHQFDAVRSGINVENGTLEFDGESWKLRDHRREDYHTVKLPVEYLQEATATRFMQFLNEVFSLDIDRADKIQLVLEAIGYSLTTSTAFERLFILTGDGANGKSVLLHVLKEIVGKDNASAVQPAYFDKVFQRAHLHRKLVNIVTELPAGAVLPDAATKAIVSGEAITVEHKMQAPFEMEPFCTLWIATNHVPGTNDFSEALSRRMIIIPFNRQFAPDEQDKLLKEKLTAELPGILNLSLEAYAGVIQRGNFTIPLSVAEAINVWKEDADVVRSFVSDMIIIDRSCIGVNAVSVSELYGEFCNYTRDTGVINTPTQREFAKRICKITGASPGRTKAARTIQGIRVLNNDDKTDPGEEEGAAC